MDLTLSPQEQRFRDELRTWLHDNHPGPDPQGADEIFEFRREWQRTMHRDGWVGIAWPREFGGRGATLMEQSIFDEEMARARAPQPINGLGLLMGGPVVIRHGTEEQKRRFLEPLLNADEIWCQGFSEPDAGSDLPALKTRAVKVDGGWSVTGQKVWTSLAHKAKWCMLVARTDPEAKRYEGLTYFLCDMEQPGVEVRPLRQITGHAEFNEVFFTDAFVPDENVVAGVGRGWEVAITTLMNERTGIAAAFGVQLLIELGELADLVREAGRDDDPAVLERFGRLRVEAETLRLNGLRGLSRVIEHGVPGPEGSLAKWQVAELNQELTRMAMDLRGLDAPLTDSRWTYRFLRARANSIEGGTTEILKNILAERVLMLPRSR
jgi:alkylation response protein AidB-like acyl-CoA dehydrogenase